MHANVRSRIRVSDGYSEKFEVKVDVHQGSVHSSLLFIIVLESLSREFRSGLLLEVHYGDDLVNNAESLEECVSRLLIWKEAMEEKGLRINAGKTNIMVRYGPGPPAELRRVLSVALEWAATASFVTAAQEMQWTQARDKRP